jgi:hypothetical protein
MEKCVKCSNNILYAKNLCKKCYKEDWYEKNKELENNKSRQHYQDNKEVINKQCREWYQNHKDYYKQDEIKNKQKAYITKRYNEDTIFRIRCTLRARLRAAIKNDHKAGFAIDELGCSIEDFRVYLESKFQPTMSWENYGLYGWHIDHIKPLSKFNLTDPEQLKQACHYSNLQPLWSEENMQKSANNNEDYSNKIKDSMYWWLGKKRSFIVNNEYKVELLCIDKINNSAKIRITNLKNPEQSVELPGVSNEQS